jgi:hypothetical protein
LIMMIIMTVVMMILFLLRWRCWTMITITIQGHNRTYKPVKPIISLLKPFLRKIDTVSGPFYNVYILMMIK